MTNSNVNLADNTETDRIQAAAIAITARQKEQEAAELAASNRPISSRSRPSAKALVAEILGRNNEDISEDARDAEASCDTSSTEVGEPCPVAVEAQTPATVQDEVPQPEPNLPESEPSNDDVDSDPRDAVQLPKQAREFGLLTRADVQAEPRHTRQ